LRDHAFFRSFVAPKPDLTLIRCVMGASGQMINRKICNPLKMTPASPSNLP